MVKTMVEKTQIFITMTINKKKALKIIALKEKKSMSQLINDLIWEKYDYKEILKNIYIEEK